MSIILSSRTIGACVLGVSVLNEVFTVGCKGPAGTPGPSGGVYNVSGTNASGNINVTNCVSTNTITCTLAFVSGTTDGTGPGRFNDVKSSTVNGACSGGAVVIPFTISCYDSGGFNTYLITAMCSDTTNKVPLAGTSTAINGTCA